MHEFSLVARNEIIDWRQFLDQIKHFFGQKFRLGPFKTCPQHNLSQCFHHDSWIIFVRSQGEIFIPELRFIEKCYFRIFEEKNITKQKVYHSLKVGTVARYHCWLYSNMFLLNSKIACWKCYALKCFQYCCSFG